MRTDTTPGCSVASDAQSRPFNGNSRSVVALTMPDIVELASAVFGRASDELATVISVPVLLV